MISGVFASLDHAWFVNDPDRQQAAVKPLQLRLAEQIGLRIPDTLITNDPAAAAAFVDRHERRVVHKTLTPPRHRFLATKEWSESDREVLDNLVLAPTIFQETVTGCRELRITVIGDRVFAAEFRPAAGLIDGRLDLETPYRPHTLPPDVSRRLLALVRQLGLVFSTIDMKLTDDGEYVFLELNPMGQYLYIEILAGLPLTAAMAELLAFGREGCSKNRGRPPSRCCRRKESRPDDQRASSRRRCRRVAVAVTSERAGHRFHSQFRGRTPSAPAATMSAELRRTLSTPRPEPNGQTDAGFLGVVVALQAVELSASIRRDAGATGCADRRSRKARDAHRPTGQPFGRAGSRDRGGGASRGRSRTRSAVVGTRGCVRPACAASPDPELVAREQLAAAESQEKVAAARLAAAVAAELAGKRARSDQLREMLRDTRIVAPFDGTIAARYVESGTTVSRGAPIVRLISPASLVVRFAVPEEQAAGICESASRSLVRVRRGT